MASTVLRSVGWAALAMAIEACASAPRSVPVYVHTLTPVEEVTAIERAKRSPIAQPRQRPLYPDKAPPPFAAGTTPPPSPFIARFAEVSHAARIEPDSDDSNFNSSYPAPDYEYLPGIGVDPGLSHDGYYGYDGWQRPW